MAYIPIDFEGSDADNLPSASSKINDNFSKSFVDEGGILTGSAGELTIDMDAPTLQFGSQLHTNPEFTSDANGWTLTNGAYWDNGCICLPAGCIDTVSITAPGSDYSVDDVLTLADGTGGTVTVTSIDGGGGVTGVNVTTVGRFYSKTTHATTGGSGSGCTIEVLTWVFPKMEQDPSYSIGEYYLLEIVLGAGSTGSKYPCGGGGFTIPVVTDDSRTLYFEALSTGNTQIQIWGGTTNESNNIKVDSVKLYQAIQYDGQVFCYNDGTNDQYVINAGSGDIGKVYIGSGALAKGAYANNCIAIGKNALSKHSAPLGIYDWPDGNIAIGKDALKVITTGNGNIVIGVEAGDELTTSASNTIIGNYAGSTVGNSNVLIGDMAEAGAASGCTKIGYRVAGGGAFQICIGPWANFGNNDDYVFCVATSSTINYLCGNMDNTGVTGYLRVRGNVEPSTDDTYDLGSASYRWDDIYATNDVIITSDERKKTAISDIGFGLDFIKSLRPIQFRWADWSHEEEVPDYEAFYEPGAEDPPPTKIINVEHTYIRQHFGFSAQEVKAVLDAKEISTTDFAPYVEAENGDLGLRRGELIPILVKAIQELETRITALESA